jgi:hypothetical protein
MSREFSFTICCIATLGWIYVAWQSVVILWGATLFLIPIAVAWAILLLVLNMWNDYAEKFL